MKFSSDKPLVSVIILCYNQAELISRAIESVLEQTYENIQLVVVEDCSKDNSREVITGWQQKYPGKIKVYFQPVNKGHPASMNTGYRLCDGELITFCDGDDWYFPEKIENEVAFLRANPGVDVVYSNFDFYTVKGQFLKHWALDEKSIPTGDVFLPLFSLAYPDRVHFRYELTSKKIIEETGHYDERIPIWVDWDFRLRLASKYKFGYCHYIGSAYTENPEGLTNILKQETILKNLQFVIEKNKPVLKKYTDHLAGRALKAISMPIQKLMLAINLHKGKHSIFKTLRFLWNYPGQLRDIRFIINSMFGKKLLRSMSVLKQKIRNTDDKVLPEQ